MPQGNPSYGKGYYDGQQDAKGGGFAGCMKSFLMLVGALTLLVVCLAITGVGG